MYTQLDLKPLGHNLATNLPLSHCKYCPQSVGCGSYKPSRSGCDTTHASPALLAVAIPAIRTTSSE